MAAAIARIWTHENSIHDTVANARACLALMRIWRCQPQRSGFDEDAELGQQLWPVIRREAGTFRRCMKDWAAARSGWWRPRGGRRRDESLEWLEQLLAKPLPSFAPRSEIHEAIGQALLLNDPTLAPLFDKVEQRLTRVAQSRTRLDRNAILLADLLQLSGVELQVLQLAAAFDAATISLSTLASVQKPIRRIQALRAAIGAESEHEVQTAVAPSSSLIRSGLISSQVVTDLEDLLRLSRQGSELLANPRCSVEAMAELVLKPLAPSKTDFPLAWPHLDTRRTLVQDAICGALARGERGVNVLLYGPPGTGKTEFARAIVEGVRAGGFSVEDTASKNLSASREDRLSSLRLSQVFAPPGRSVLVLDEAEDIFQEDYFRPSRGEGRQPDSKAWMNSLLETNRTPVLWISNRIEHIDPAYLRRFTYCLEFPTTPREVRRTIAETYLAPVGGTQALVDSVAAEPHLAPAMVAAAARFVRLAGAEGPRADDVARQMLTDHLKAQGKAAGPQLPERATRFDFAYLNIEGDIAPAAVVEALHRTGTGSVLMMGPPGTGKTQLAAETAKVLGRELTYRTAADINSMWYGQSERNVAALFDDCEPRSQVLFVDEADTLLGARESANHRADRAVTAEFLRRLEAFRGVFLCATNHARELDAALMRRFVFRLSFMPLNRKQRQSLLAEAALGWSPCQPMPALDPHLAARLDRLHLLTPGDLANVAKRFRVLGVQADIQEWLVQLEAEHAAKPGAARSAIGFV